MELAILLGDRHRNIEEENVPPSISLFLGGRLEEVLQHDSSKQIIGQNPGNNKHLDGAIVHNVKSYLTTEAGDDTSLRELEVLVTGAACLQLFVQNNWLGPPTSAPPTCFLPEPWTDDTMVQDLALTFLAEDGEPTYNLSKYAAFLQIARIILLDCRHLCSSLQTWDWWLVRCLGIQQALLDQRSPTLRATILERIEDISKKETLLTSDSNRDIAVLFHVEASRLCQLYWEDARSREHVAQAKKLAGIHVGLTGALGKRTRFQEEHKAQLMVQVTREQGEETLSQCSFCASEIGVPKNLPMDDDTVLNKIDFKNAEDNIAIKLCPLEQALLFAVIYLAVLLQYNHAKYYDHAVVLNIIVVMEAHRRAVASERLTEEEVMAYLDFILNQVTSWSVAVSALVRRSVMEKNSRRRVERSMQQLEELVNNIHRQEPTPAHRLHLFYAVLPPATWVLQGELATLLISLGCVGAALDIYERLHLWEDAILCYQQLGKREKAESVIREQLAVKETPNLLCFLGDVTRDPLHYQRAWELSNQRSARAMRCLGYVHFSEERYDAAVECFEKSLTINSLQIPVWFTCGCACMAAKKYEDAVRAFRRCVNIDYDNFEAWSNLATAYARLKKVDKAFLTVKDAIKCSYENWRLWENCLLFATDCGEFEEAIRAYHRLIDLKDKWTDVQVLGILVRAVVENIKDNSGRPAARLHGKLTELFGRITAKVTNNAEIWRLYAELVRTDSADHKSDIEKCLQLFQKSHRCLIQESGWEKDEKKCKDVAEHSKQLAEVYLTSVGQAGNTVQATPLLSSAKFMLKGVVSKIKQQYTDPVSGSMPEGMVSVCQSLESELQTVISKLEELKSS